MNMYDADRAALKAMGNSDPDAVIANSNDVIANARRLTAERRKQQKRDHAIVLAALRWLQACMDMGMRMRDPMMDELDDILEPAGLSVITLDTDDIDRICEDLNFDN